jgi:hypothetical protein
VTARGKTVETLKKDLTDNEKAFLVSLKSGQPNWDLMVMKGIETLSAIRWKLANSLKLGAKKRAELLEKLKRTIEM